MAKIPERQAFYTQRQAYVAVQNARTAMHDAVVTGRLQTVRDVDAYLDLLLEKLLEKPLENCPFADCCKRKRMK